MKLTDKELRELDTWTAENVFGWHYVSRPKNCIQQSNWASIKWPLFIPKGHPLQSMEFPSYTTDPAAAMEVLKKVNEKCGVIKIIKIGGGYWFVNDNQKSCEGKAETLELAIALFAKKLYSKDSH